MELRADPGSLAHRIGRDGIAAVVDVFYTRIQGHPSLAGPFGIVEDWPHHKEKLTHFWWVLLGGDPYMEVDYSVPMKHFQASSGVHTMGSPRTLKLVLTRTGHPVSARKRSSNAW